MIAWSLEDSANVIEAEEVLATLPIASAADDVYYACQMIIWNDTEKARKALKARVRSRVQAEAASYAEAEIAASARMPRSKK